MTSLPVPLPLPLVLPDPAPETGGVRLRGLAGRDVAMVQDLATDPYVPMTGSLPKDADAEQALAWIERQHDRLVTGAGYSFCIADRVTDRAVGQVGLWLAPVAQGRATAGYGVAPKARGRGLARDALRGLTDFAWTLPGLHRVELYVEPWNEASLRTAEGAGYQREGMLRSHQAIGGVRVDMVLLAAIRPI